MASNRKVAGLVAGVAVGMFALAYASVPLYQLFCQVTGYGGTTQVATAAPGEHSASPPRRPNRPHQPPRNPRGRGHRPSFGLPPAQRWQVNMSGRLLRLW